MIEGATFSTREENKLMAGEMKPEDINWTTVLPQTKLRADNEHHFEDQLVNNGPFTHARLTIFPDGGVSRLRLWGRIR